MRVEEFAAPQRTAVHAECLECPVRGLCFLPGAQGKEPPPDAVAISRRRVAAGGSVNRQAPAAAALHVVRMGTLKSVRWLASGREQVAGFHLPGDVLGADALAEGRPNLAAVALEDAQLCVVPYEPLVTAAITDTGLRDRLWKAIGGEIVRHQRTTAILGNSHAEARVAAFLLDTAQRMKQRGYSAHEFHLRMAREEIASYLGLSLETVSRTLNQLIRQGALALDKRHVRLLDMAQLERASEDAMA